jgi:hypothetical protein
MNIHPLDALQNWQPIDFASVPEAHRAGTRLE